MAFSADDFRSPVRYTFETMPVGVGYRQYMDKLPPCASTAEYYRDYDYASQHLIHQLRLWLLRGEKTYQEVEILTEPINWWQMLVRDHFPEWYKSRWPVRCKERRYVIEKEIRVCPHVGAFDRKHVDYLLFDTLNYKEEEE